METRNTLPPFVIGTLLFGVVVAGCGSSSDSDDPDATPTPTSTATVSAPSSPTPSPTMTATGSPSPTPTTRPGSSLVTEGARLFFQETFDGNGRTCGTCHPAETGFTLTPGFIASRPPTDPLFVAERIPELAGLEDPALMHGPRALILENVDGFDQPPVFRGVPHTFDLALTAPFGWGGTIFQLDEFVVAAVRQHFPRTLRRVPGVDFRLPTQEETAALVAFMQSTTLVPNGVTQFDFGSVVRTETQQRGEAVFFGNGKCSFCHDGPLLTGNGSFDTGVTRRTVNAAAPPGCDPSCMPLGEREDRNGHRAFNVPTLLGLANSAPYFHDNSAASIREAVAHYVSPEFNGSDGGSFLLGIQMTETEIDDVAAFLAALTLCGDGVATHGEPCDDGNAEIGDGCRPNCTLEACGDGIVDPGERCDTGVVGEPDDCTSRCER